MRLGDLVIFFWVDRSEAGLFWSVLRLCGSCLADCSPARLADGELRRSLSCENQSLDTEEDVITNGNNLARKLHVSIDTSVLLQAIFGAAGLRQTPDLEDSWIATLYTYKFSHVINEYSYSDAPTARAALWYERCDVIDLETVSQGHITSL